MLLQFVQLRLGGLAVAFGAFVLRVLGADLFFQPCEVFARLGVLLLQGVVLLLLFALG